MPRAPVLRPCVKGSNRAVPAAPRGRDVIVIHAPPTVKPAGPDRRVAYPVAAPPRPDRQLPSRGSGSCSISPPCAVPPGRAGGERPARDLPERRASRRSASSRPPALQRQRFECIQRCDLGKVARNGVPTTVIPGEERQRENAVRPCQPTASAQRPPPRTRHARPAGQIAKVAPACSSHPRRRGKARALP